MQMPSDVALRCASLTHGIRLGRGVARHERGRYSGRVEWRRGELNPRPEITRMAASTCVVDVLISIPAAGIDTLRGGPAV